MTENNSKGVRKSMNAIVTAAVGGALAVGAIAWARNSLPTQIYRTEDKCDIEYKENDFRFGEEDFWQNKMVIKDDDGNVYELYDTVGETSINSPRYIGDRLEKIIIKSRGKRESFQSKNRYSDTLNDNFLRELFGKADSNYNGWRSRIRDDEVAARKEKLMEFLSNCSIDYR